MKVKQIFSLIFVGASFFSACDKKDNCNNREGDYSHGVFVVNEGPFGGTGTITWHDPATGETVQDVYGVENCGAALGQFVQSISFHNSKGYIVVNGGNKVVIVDERTFKYLGVIEGLELPRFFLGVDDQYAYVSQWGSDGIAGSLAKIDLQSKRIIKTIPVGSGPEKMLLSGNKVFVANSGGYGVDSTLVEINTNDDQIIQRYMASGKNPSSLVFENQGTNPVYLCKGYYLLATIIGNLNQLTGGPADGYAVPAFSDDLVIDDSGQMFFTTNTQIYGVEGSAGQYAITPLFTQNAYGLGLDKGENLLYCADPKDFSAAGTVVVRKFDGTTVGSFPTGIAPGEILIK